jgi:hypothetical protein
MTSYLTANPTNFNMNASFVNENAQGVWSEVMGSSLDELAVSDEQWFGLKPKSGHCS